MAGQKSITASTQFKDITGMRYGSLVVMFRDGHIGEKIAWRCRCDCGNTVHVTGNSIKTGNTRSCGCLKIELSKIIKADHVGKRFGRLLVMKHAGLFDNGSHWVCECDCGSTATVAGCSLTSGLTQSCGCLLTEAITSHGLSGAHEYRAWQSARHRCQHKSCHSYERYGGRGISVCAGMMESPKYLLQSIGAKPSQEHSIDRIDNNRGYECGVCNECKLNGIHSNIRWATRFEQANNTSTNRFYAAFGRSLTIAQWCAEFGMNYDTLYGRIKRGWRIEDALTVPVRSKAFRKACRR